jgi:hypothetical protein
VAAARIAAPFVRRSSLGNAAAPPRLIGLPGNALVNDVVIVLFGVDLAILVSPWI